MHSADSTWLRNHFEAAPLPETIDAITVPTVPAGDGWKEHTNFGASDDGYEKYDAGTGGTGNPEAPPAPPARPDMYAAFNDGTWKEILKDVEPEVDGAGGVWEVSKGRAEASWVGRALKTCAVWS